MGRISARPNRVVLAYPVASFGEHTHLGSVHNLLGNPPNAQLCEQLANDRHMTGAHPPTFLFHTADDAAVPVELSLRYATALREHGVPFELHVFPTGRHGVGLAINDPALRGWSRLLLDWLAPWQV